MKSMLAVAKLISRQKLRKLDILTEDVLNPKASKFRELYDALQDGTVRNDREAAQLLYAAGPTDARYRQLKSRFRKRLLNTLFFVDQNRPHQTSFDQTFHNCQRDWSLINILRANDATDPAQAMAKSLLTCCQKFGFSELSVQAARFLADYAALHNDHKAVTQLEAVIAENAATLQLELTSEGLLRQLKLHLRQHEAQPQLAICANELQEIGQQLDALSEQTGSPVVHFDAFEGWCIINKISELREAVVAVVSEAITFCEQHPRQMQEQRMRCLRFAQVAAFIELRDAERGLAAIDALDLLYKPGTDTWQEIRRYHCALLLATDQGAKAARLVAAVQRHKSFERLAAFEQESWRIFAALAYALAPSKTDFDVEAFLRRQPHFGRDHQRLHAWRMMLTALLSLKLRRTAAAGDAVGELRNLAVKHLDAKQDVRFIAAAQVLYRLERKHFAGDLDRVGERYLHDLTSVGFHVSVSDVRFEPVPLEKMLEAFGLEVGGAVVA